MRQDTKTSYIRTQTQIVAATTVTATETETVAPATTEAMVKIARDETPPDAPAPQQQIFTVTTTVLSTITVIDPQLSGLVTTTIIETHISTINGAPMYGPQQIEATTEPMIQPAETTIQQAKQDPTTITVVVTKIEESSHTPMATTIIQSQVSTVTRTITAEPTQAKRWFGSAGRR